MVRTNNGLNALRDFLQSDIAVVAVGTGTTTPQKTDTSLANQVYEEAVNAAVDDGTGEVTIVIRLDTSEANGNDLTEVGTEDGDGNLQDRKVHSALSKTSSKEVEYRITLTAQNPQ